MKKIFTLMLLVAGTAGIANAQFKNQKDMVYNDNKKVNDHVDPNSGYGNSSYNDSYYFSLREKEAKLKKIDAIYDQKIAAVKYNRRLNGRQKAKQIQMLEDQKRSEIWQVEQQFAKNNKAWDKAKGHDGKKW